MHVRMLGRALIPLLAFAGPMVAALGEPKVIQAWTSNFDETELSQVPFQPLHHDRHFVISNKHHGYSIPILLDSQDDVAVHIAARTFAEDVRRVTGLKPALYNDTLPTEIHSAIIVGTIGSKAIESLSIQSHVDLKGKWESYDARVISKPLDNVKEALVVAGSDRVGSSTQAWKRDGLLTPAWRDLRSVHHV